MAVVVRYVDEQAASQVQNAVSAIALNGAKENEAFTAALGKPPGPHSRHERASDRHVDYHRRRDGGRRRRLDGRRVRMD